MHPLAAVLEAAPRTARSRPPTAPSTLLPPDACGLVGDRRPHRPRLRAGRRRPRGAATPPAPMASAGRRTPTCSGSSLGPGGEIGALDVVLVGRGRGRPGAAPPPRPRRPPARASGPRPPPRRRGVRRRRSGSSSSVAGWPTGASWRSSCSTRARPGGAGHGRRLIRAGLAALAPGTVCWAQVSPGNAASLRAFLACGFVPIGSEILIRGRAAEYGRRPCTSICPRCGRDVDERYYGPCTSCRDELRAAFAAGGSRRRGRRVRAEDERHAERGRHQGRLTRGARPSPVRCRVPGDVAQLVAHRLCKAGVEVRVPSSPPRPGRA